MVNSAIQNVLVVDDHPMVLQVMSAVAESAFRGAVVRTADGLEEALSVASSMESLDLALLDLGLPGCSGIASLIAFRKAFPASSVVVISAMDDRHIVLAALDAGAKGYVPKTSKPPVIAAALQLVAAGGVYVPPLAIAGTGDASRALVASIDLTGRQKDVLRLIIKGLANKQIAQHLRIAQDTVKKHAKVVFAALGVSNRSQAARAAEQRGIDLH